MSQQPNSDLRRGGDRFLNVTSHLQVALAAGLFVQLHGLVARDVGDGDVNAVLRGRSPLPADAAGPRR
jgi:hypothetical protein